MKEYTKPDIIFDSFSLSTSIAAGCEVKTQTPSDMKCGVEFGPDVMFLEGIDACTDKVVDGTDKYCYHNPTDTSNMFNS